MKKEEEWTHELYGNILLRSYFGQSWYKIHTVGSLQLSFNTLARLLPQATESQTWKLCLR